MSMEEMLKEKAKQQKKTIALAEGADERIVEAGVRAAAEGIAAAQFAVGLCLNNGTGTEKNPEQAMEWFRKAADQGNPDAAVG